MKSNRRLVFILLLPVLLGAGGCATLPKASEVIDGAKAREPAQILTTRGLLTPEKSMALMDSLKQTVPPTDVLHRYSSVIETISESPLTTGNKVTLLIDGPETYASMFEAMENARDHINLETFIIEDDEIGRKFSDLLLKKKAEGVHVHLIYDAIGSRKTPSSFFRRLLDGGIKIVAFSPIDPPKDVDSWAIAYPDHRKILVVDGKVAFTGGINISEVYSSDSSGSKRGKKEKEPKTWRDTDVRIEGPAVAEFQKLFLDTWDRQKGPRIIGPNYFPKLEARGNALVQAVASSPGKSNRLNFILYVAAITFAEHSIHLTNAYFVPDRETLDALREAAVRGVDVKLIVPGRTDVSMIVSAGRHHYAELLESGVRIFERHDAVLHAKTAVVDGIWSTVGSTNLDFWSLSVNDEVNAVILDKEFAAEMERMFAGDIEKSREIRLEEWKKRPFLKRFKEWFANRFKRWL